MSSACLYASSSGSPADFEHLGIDVRVRHIHLPWRFLGEQCGDELVEDAAQHGVAFSAGTGPPAVPSPASEPFRLPTSERLRRDFGHGRQHGRTGLTGASTG
jgi:hypothetical protein